MISRKARFFVLLLLPLSFLMMPLPASSASQDVTLQVTEAGNAFMLSVPASKLVMTIPKRHLFQKQNTDHTLNASPRYFYFHDTKRDFVVSGWFESSDEYANFRKYWEEEKASWKSRQLPMPQNEKYFRSGGWQGVIFDIPITPGASSHIKAHWVQAGTWIDVHISLTAQSRNSVLRGQLLEFLKSIKVKQRT